MRLQQVLHIFAKDGALGVKIYEKLQGLSLGGSTTTQLRARDFTIIQVYLVVFWKF